MLGRASPARPGRASLDGDGGAGALESGLGLLGGVLGDLLQDRLRRVVDQVLGLLEAERGQAAHLLDDLDLLVAGSLEDDVELVLLGSGLLATAAAPVAVAAAGAPAAAGGDAGDAADQDEFDVVLEAAGDKKIQVIKEVVPSRTSA